MNTFIYGLLPSIGVGLLFWYAMRSVLRADRRERSALAEEREKRETPEATNTAE